MAADIKKKVINSFFTVISFLRVIMLMPHGSCKYYPTCTEYSKEAFSKLPFHIAIFKTMYRLIRCNPFSNGGYDPVVK